MTYYYPNGLSTRSDAHRLLKGAIYTSAPVFFVDSVNGNDAWLGTNTLRPLATLVAATSVGEYRFIVLKNGHSETYTSAQAVEVACIVSEVVEGASLTMNAAAAGMFSAPSGNGAMFVGLKFPVQLQANSASRCTFAQTGIRLTDCAFYFDGNDDNTAVVVSGASARVEGCTFKCSGTSSSDLPSYSLLGATATTGEVRECVFDAGVTSVNDEFEMNLASGTNTMWLVYGNTFKFGAQGKVNPDHVGYSGTVHGGGGLIVDPGVHIYTGGIATDATDALLVSDHVSCTDPVLWVDSASGSDTNDGDRETPFATLSAAVSAMSAGTGNRIIVLKSTHDETLTSGVAFSLPGTVVVGESGAKLTMGADANMLTTNAAVELRNITLDSSVALGASSFLVTLNAAFCSIVGCTFNCNANISAAALNVGAQTDTMVRDCTFVSTSTTTAPNQAMRFAASDRLSMDGVTFDGGSTGFATYALENTAAASPVRIADLTLKNGADAFVHSNSEGFVQVTADETSSVEAF